MNYDKLFQEDLIRDKLLVDNDIKRFISSYKKKYAKEKYQYSNFLGKSYIK
jgi:hypothetical protein